MSGPQIFCSLQRPEQAAVERPASRLQAASACAALPLSGSPLRSDAETAPAETSLALTASAEQPPLCPVASEPQAAAPAAGSKDNLHPMPPKVCLNKHAVLRGDPVWASLCTLGYKHCRMRDPPALL